MKLVWVGRERRPSPQFLSPHDLDRRFQAVDSPPIPKSGGSLEPEERRPPLGNFAMKHKTHLLLALIVWAGLTAQAWAEEKAHGDLGGAKVLPDHPAEKVTPKPSPLYDGLYPALGRFYRAMTAAEKGDADAQVIVGAGYQHGIHDDWGSDQVARIAIYRGGVEKDIAEALKWYLKAAEQGNAKGQRALARIYLSGGRGVPKNVVLAYKWAIVSSPEVLASLGPERLESGQEDMVLFALPEPIASSEDKIFLTTIFKLEKLLSPEQRAEGQKLAREFKPVVQK